MLSSVSILYTIPESSRGNNHLLVGKDAVFPTPYGQKILGRVHLGYDRRGYDGSDAGQLLGLKPMRNRPFGHRVRGC